MGMLGLRKYSAVVCFKPGSNYEACLRSIGVIAVCCEQSGLWKCLSCSFCETIANMVWLVYGKKFTIRSMHSHVQTLVMSFWLL
jgi:hypothetical protein